MATLELPYICIIPYHVQIDTSISDAAKIYYGQIAPLAKKTGYIWATDEQLAEMKCVSIRTIKRWNDELEKAGHIKRVTHNFPKKENDGDFSWVKKRKIYINDGFVLRTEDEEESNEVQKEVSKKYSVSVKNGTSYEGAKNGTSYEGAKNGTIINTSIDSIYKQQQKKAVVVPSCLKKLSISERDAIQISERYTPEEIELAVERCLNWSSRQNDLIGIHTTLRDAASWNDSKSKQEHISESKKLLEGMRNLSGKKIGSTTIGIGPSYLEFHDTQKSVVFSIDDPHFKNKVGNYYQQLTSNLKKHSSSKYQSLKY